MPYRGKAYLARKITSNKSKDAIMNKNANKKFYKAIDKRNKSNSTATKTKPKPVASSASKKPVKKKFKVDVRKKAAVGILNEKIRRKRRLSTYNTLRAKKKIRDRLKASKTAPKPTKKVARKSYTNQAARDRIAAQRKSAAQRRRERIARRNQ